MKRSISVTGFYLHKAVRVLTVLLKGHRKLEPIVLNYYKGWHFENAYLVIDYKFKNAIWYRLGKIRRIKSNTPLVVNLTNITSNDDLILEVHGLYEKKMFRIEISRDFKFSLSQFRLSSISTQFPYTLLSSSLKSSFPAVRLEMLSPESKMRRFTRCNLKTHVPKLNDQKCKILQGQLVINMNNFYIVNK